MAKDQTKRLNPTVIQEDISVLEAIQGMEDYAPSNPAYSVTTLNAQSTTMSTAQMDETQKKGAFDAARDTANAAEWAFHNSMLGAKDQVKAQYGADSDEWQSLGLKKKSEYKKPSKKAPASTRS